MDEITKALHNRRMAISNKIADSFEKGKKVPVGTVTNGRRKVAEGKWVADSGTKEGLKEKHADRVTVMQGGKRVSLARKDAVKQGYKRKHFINNK